MTTSEPAPAPVDDPGRKKKKKAVDPLEWTRDNIEAIAVAFLMALIIRCFCVEVFKIPTGSMEPTLYGDTKPTDMPPHHVGDRIMVDKVGLMLGPVDRYDVCVFRYPLDRSRNFIKRLVGQPDEDLMIDAGDLWARPHQGGDGKFHIARKPASKQVGIWLPVWPDTDTSRETCRKLWDGAADDCYLEGNVYDTSPANGRETAFRYHREVQGVYKGLGSNQRVYDLSLRFKATFREGKGKLFVRNRRADGYGSFTVSIAADGTVSIDHEGGDEFTPSVPAPAPLKGGAIGAAEEIEVANFDGAVRVRVDGKEVLAWEYVDAHPGILNAVDPPVFQIQFGSEGGAVRFEDVTLGRDIFYWIPSNTCFAGKNVLSIPPGKYLAIGDNVGNSKDGRLWKERVVKLKDGTTITGDYESQEAYPQESSKGKDGRYRMRDLDGTDHFFREEDIEDDGSGKPVWHPFVSREELVGKAMIVWWPLPRFKVIR